MGEESEPMIWGWSEGLWVSHGGGHQHDQSSKVEKFNDSPQWTEGDESSWCGDPNGLSINRDGQVFQMKIESSHSKDFKIVFTTGRIMGGAWELAGSSLLKKVCL
ncbi:hypothetical protein Nepgr_011799 [Nepenthes gracilis]|uniref:Uncharacterized protein n=1 Tax=Nepenthes gracilis TaxID=150966 RepID=A0AAD3XM86_NEPGR|nr:hypothetical protein Nepgr_011799 [Nepenthes gracilis]